MKKPLRKSRRATARKRARTTSRVGPVAPVVAPSSGKFVDIDLEKRWRSEIHLIGSALAGVPPLDREAQRREVFPYHDVINTPRMDAVIPKILRRRDPDNAWIDVERALLKVDDAGDGHGLFMGMYREVVFMAGVEYALRSLPPWWKQFQSMDEEMRRGVALVVEAAGRRQAEREKGGE